VVFNGAEVYTGVEVSPIAFWAEAFGMVTDKFGVKWRVNCDAPK
jgi:uncharacterized glyoxalase superfamily protein PhnB